MEEEKTYDREDEEEEDNVGRVASSP